MRSTTSSNARTVISGLRRRKVSPACPGGRVSPVSKGEMLSTVNVLREDRQGNFWIGTNRGLARLRGVAVEPLDAGEGVSEDTVVLGLLEDRGGKPLDRDGRNGLLRLSDSPIVSYTRREGLTNDFVRPLFEDTRGTVWFGTRGGGLNRLHEGRISALTGRDGFAFDSVSALTQSRDGALWAGIPTGEVVRWNEGRARVYGSADGLPASSVRVLVEDSRGAALDRDRRRGRRPPAGGASSSIAARRPRPATNVRFSPRGPGGPPLGRHLRRASRSSRTAASPATARAEGLTDLLVRSHPRGRGRHSVGRHLRRRPLPLRGRTLRLDQQPGRPAQRHHLRHHRGRVGNLWMSCNKGIFRVSRKELEDRAAGKVRLVNATTFGVDEGMRGNECNGGSTPRSGARTTAACGSPRSRDWCGCDPGVPSPQRGGAPVVIESLSRTAGAWRPSDGARLAARPPPPGHPLRRAELPFPRRVRMAFKLDGFDSGLGGRGHAAHRLYTNLPPGPYTFRVKAANARRRGQREGARWASTSEPRFYETNLFTSPAWPGARARFAAYRVRIAQLRGARGAAQAQDRGGPGQRQGAERPLPVCASCKKIRDDKGYWSQIETYIRDHSEADFSHGICPECMSGSTPSTPRP